MVAKKSSSLAEIDDFDVDGSSKSTARGYFGRALREGRVHKAKPWAPRTLDVLLRVLNVVLWLLLVAFMAWRLYAIYLVEST